MRWRALLCVALPCEALFAVEFGLGGSGPNAAEGLLQRESGLGTEFAGQLVCLIALPPLFAAPVQRDGNDDNFFFWDTVQLGSIHAQFYFDNNFSFFFLPENIDSGHPPTFGIYIALIWKIFGKSLVTSHFAMLPFLMGIIFYAEKLGKYFFQDSIFTFAFILLLIVDPCLAGQAILVTPDIAIAFFFLMSLDGAFNQKRKILAIGVAGLCLISMRGIMVAAAIF